MPPATRIRGVQIADNTVTSADIDYSLDEAYDSGGSGVGRTITADAGPVVINSGGNLALEITGTATLTAGVYYPIRIQFGEQGGGDVMTFNHSTATIGKTTNVTGKVFYNRDTNGF